LLLIRGLERAPEAAFDIADQTRIPAARPDSFNQSLTFQDRSWRNG
jgi:hypothetical protein